MKYRYLLFDLDGTLIDTTEGVFKCAQYALKHFGIETDFNELRAFFGPPLKVSFSTLYQLSENDADRAVKYYLERYEKEGLKESRVYPEIPSLLEDLKKAGYILGVATSKFEEHAIKSLEQYGIAKYFDYITGANKDETRSKKHEVIIEALDRFGIKDDKTQVLMIGDMKYDVIGAHTVGIECFGIYTGTASENELETAGADYVGYHFDSLRSFLLNN